MAGTIPTVVDYGIRLLNPNIFFLTTAVICALVGVVTGSSWTTAGTLGVAFVGDVEGDGALAGHRRRSGDLRRVLRRQDDAALGDDDPRPEARRARAHGRAAHPEHVLDRRPRARDQPRHLPRARPERDAGRRGRAPIRRATILGKAFNISALNLLPLVVLVVFTVKKVPPFLAILGSALFAGILACFTQWTNVKAFVDEPGLGTDRHRDQGDLHRDGDRLRALERLSRRSTSSSRGAGWQAC